MIRRWLIIGAVSIGLGGCLVAAPEAGCSVSEIGPVVESRLGVDYSEYGPELAAILSQGEAERLAKSAKAFETLSDGIQQAVRAEWNATVTELFLGSLAPRWTGGDEPSFDFLRAATPTMLARLKACGPALDDRLAYLDTIALEVPSVPGGEE